MSTTTNRLGASSGTQPTDGVRRGGFWASLGLLFLPTLSATALPGRSASSPYERRRPWLLISRFFLPRLRGG